MIRVSHVASLNEDKPEEIADVEIAHRVISVTLENGVWIDIDASTLEFLYSKWIHYDK